MTAGKRENSDHTMVRTESVTDCGSIIGLPISSVIMLAPDQPSSSAMSDPETAVPNFCDIVPEEKMSPVMEVPKCSVW